MSDVRLSNASPTLERVDARQPDNVRPSVRRNLFGTPDPEELGSYFTASMQENVQAFTERYNFDPVEERPLTPRNYEWVEDDSAPEFYHRPPHGSQRPRRGVDGHVHGGGALLDVEESRERQAGRREPRKRRSEDSGSCSSECQRKRSHTDGDDDDDDDDENQSGRAGSQAEERPTRPEQSAEVQ